MKSLKLIIVALILSLPAFASHLRIDTLYSKQWDPGKEKWEDFKRTIVKINGDLILSELVQIPHKRNSWENYSLRIYAYNQSNQLVQVLDKFWQSGMETWEDNYLMLYQYNSDGQLESLTHTNIYNSKPFLCSREYYEYNDAGFMTEKIIQRYDNNNWVNFMKTEFFRPSTGILLAEDNYYWNNGSWGNIHSTTKFQYGNNGELTVREKDMYVAGGMPVTKTSQKMNYNSDGLLYEIKSYILNETTLGWEPDYKLNFTYEPEEKLYTRSYEIWNEGGWENYVTHCLPSDVPRLFEKQILEDMSVCIIPGDSKNSLIIAFDNFNHEKYQVRLLNNLGGEITNISTDECEVTINTLELDEAEYYIEIQGTSLYSGKLLLN